MKRKLLYILLPALFSITISCGKDNKPSPVPGPEPGPDTPDVPVEPPAEASSWTWTFSYAKGSEEENEALATAQTDWAEKQILYSDQGQEATITIKEADGKTATSINTATFSNAHAYIRGIYYMDSFIVSAPVEKLPAGSTVTLTGSMAGSGSSAGFFLAECSTDGGASWKQAGGTRKSTIAGESFYYHCSPQDSFNEGDGDFGASFITGEAISNNTLLMRLIATPNYRITRTNDAGNNPITTGGGGSTRLRGKWILTLTPDDGEHEQDFSIDKTEVSFAGSNYSATDVLVRSWGEGVSISSEGLDWLTESPEATLDANSALSLTLKPAGANIRGKRSGTITVTGLTGKRTQTITVSQDDLYEAVDGFPAKWEISSTTYANGNAAAQRWETEGISVATEGSKKGYLSTVSVSGKALKHSIYSNTVAVEGMSTGDYLLFSVPVKHVSAGTDLDFFLTLDVSAENSPKYWVFEYRDGETWKGVDRVRKAEDGTEFSFYTKYFSSTNHTTFIQSFALSEAVDNDFVQVRCRVAGDVSDGGPVYLPRFTYMSCYLICYEGAPVPEYKGSLMALGNSFTYYYGTLWMLKEIARREGIQLQITANLKGSQSFRMHLDNLELSNWVMEQGGYNYALLQQTSFYAADFYRDGCRDNDDILIAARELTAKVRKYSPDAYIVLERTWSYPKADGLYAGYGSYEKFDEYLDKGSQALAARIPDIDVISPIGNAFIVARSQGYSLNYTDSFHQSRLGAYLKSCVNYLLLFGRRFGASPADCGVEPADAAAMRKIAEDIVFAPVPGEGDGVSGNLEDMNPRNPDDASWN